MKIAYNVSAMIANNALSKNDDRLAQSLQRLSSGLKIVEGKDNPAGLAMAKRMDAQIASIAVATQNSSDGISIIETADGALSEVHSILQRMNELLVKASTGTVTEADRANINEEVNQMKQEINRISKDTEFNGQNLLDGGFDLKGYTDQQNCKVGYYSDSVIAQKYQVEDLTVAYDAEGKINNVTATLGTNFPADARIESFDGQSIKIVGGNGFEMELMMRKGETGPIDVEIDATGIGAMRMQTGANEGQVLDIRIPEVSLERMKIQDVNSKTAEDAKESLDRVGNAINYVSSVRSRLGAYQNRLEHGISSLDITSENMTAAYSRIMDVDMAEEMTEYTTVQVISQASMNMLAQANERPAQVLQLLQQ